MGGKSLLKEKEGLACVILNYNDSETTLSLINKIKTYEILDYIVIVDNQSSDNSLEKLRKIQTSKIIVICSEKNGGYGYGNNYGIWSIKENLKNIRYVLIANPDTMFEENLIKELKYLMGQHPNCVIAAPEHMNTIQDVAWKEISARRFILQSSYVFCRIFGRKEKYTKEELKRQNYKVDMVLGALLLIEIDKFIKMGMYDEGIFLYTEETVIGKRAKKYQYETRLLPETTYQHTHSVTISKAYRSALKQKKLNLKSDLYYLKKYCGLSGVTLGMTKLYFVLAVLEMYPIQAYLFLKNMFIRKLQ